VGGRSQEKKTSPQVRQSPWGELHPIQKTPKRDFLDGALVGAGVTQAPLVLFLSYGPTHLEEVIKNR
jgi:hypothetical protein